MAGPGGKTGYLQFCARHEARWKKRMPETAINQHDVVTHDNIILSSIIILLCYCQITCMHDTRTRHVLLIIHSLAYNGMTITVS